MIYLIKFLLPFLVISCSFIENFQDTNRSLYDGNYINKSKFNLSIINNYQRWESEEGQVYLIDNGKVFRTYGLDNNFEILNFKSFDFNELLRTPIINKNYLIKFTNPSTTYIDIKYSYRIINNDDTKSYNEIDFIVEEKFDVPLIRWVGKNYYWVKGNRVIRSQQKLTPFSKSVQIYAQQKNSGM